MYLTKRERELEKAQQRGRADFLNNRDKPPVDYSDDKGLQEAWKAGYQSELEFDSEYWNQGEV